MKLLKALAITVVAIVILLLIIPFFINVNSFKPKVESEMTSATGRKCEVGNLSLSLITGSVSADNISIADDPAFGKGPFVTAKSLKIGVELMPLIFSKELKVTGVTLEQPEINLISNAKGVWNFSTIGNTPKAGRNQGDQGAHFQLAAQKTSSSPMADLSVAEIRVTDGKLVIGKTSPNVKPLTLDKVDITVKNFSTTTQFPFTLSAGLPAGGDLKLDGKAGPLAAADTPVEAAIKVHKLELANLGMDPSVGLGGEADLDGNLASDGRVAKVTGTLTANKLKMSPKGSPAGKPVDVKFATNYNLKAQGGTLSQGDVSTGKAVAHLTGKYQAEGEATVLNMKLDAPGMPVDDVETLLPALGVVLPSGAGLKGGTLSANLSINGPTDKLVIAGPVKLENSTLTGFDMGSKLSALSAIGGKAPSGKDTVIQNFSTDARVAPEGTKADNINLNVPSIGVVTGSGTVSPAGALDFHMVANLSGGVAGGLTQVANIGGKGGSGGGGIPFMIQGTTSNPTFLPDVKGMASSAAKGAIEGAVSGKGGSNNPAGALGGLFKKKP